MNKSDRELNPHRAAIRFSIDIREMLQDGSLSGVPLTHEELLKYKLGSFGHIIVEGVTRADCIKQIKEKLGAILDTPHK